MGERFQINEGGVEIIQGCQLGIDIHQLGCRHPPRRDQVEQERRAQAISSQQQVDRIEDATPVNGRQRVGRPPLRGTAIARSPNRSIIRATKAGTNSGTSQPVAYAASHPSGKADNPAWSPSSGPRPSRRSRATRTVAGRSGKSCFGAATTTISRTACPSRRTTR